MFHHLAAICPSFGGKTYRRFPHRFKRMIHVVDPSTIQLIAKCMDWAKERRKKAAVKLHMCLDLQSFFPKFAIVVTAGHNDNRRARELYADIGAGEIVLFDKAYVDFEHLYDLDRRGVFCVTRARSAATSRCRSCGVMSSGSVVSVSMRCLRESFGATSKRRPSVNYRTRS
ncbi:MAG TPA: transposase [Candidatus Hydrogenedentes bacterium]|nr:transposase [Candidatus Hydrogenedentota bacterium]